MRRGCLNVWERSLTEKQDIARPRGVPDLGLCWFLEVMHPRMSPAWFVAVDSGHIDPAAGCGGRQCASLRLCTGTAGVTSSLLEAFYAPSKMSCSVSSSCLLCTRFFISCIPPSKAQPSGGFIGVDHTHAGIQIESPASCHHFSCDNDFCERHCSSP